MVYICIYIYTPSRKSIEVLYVYCNGHISLAWLSPREHGHLLKSYSFPPLAHTTKYTTNTYQIRTQECICSNKYVPTPNAKTSFVCCKELIEEIF